MKVVLNLEVQRIRQTTELAADHTEDRISLDGKMKCIERDISLGGVQSLSDAAGTLSLLDAAQDPGLEYDANTMVGKLFVEEQYGEWQITAEVVLSPERFRELWERLKQDKTLRSGKLLIDGVNEGSSPKQATFKAKDVFQVEAVEIEFHHEF